MELSVEELAGKAIVRIAGPVRLGEVPALWEQVNALSTRDLAIELDLGEVEHLHAAAWQVLVALQRSATARGQPVLVSQVSAATRSVMAEYLNLQSWLSNQQDVD